MTKVCNKHKADPAIIYGECVGCEIDELWDKVKHLQEENKTLHEDGMAVYGAMNDKRVDKLKADVDFYRCALEDLIIYAKAIKKRAGVRLDDPNLGALDHAESILKVREC